MKNDNKDSESQTLRQKAEELLKMKPTKTDSSLSAVETAKLIHELEVHQIELELQNEELITARSTLQRLATQYTELYDLAPSGYFTLSSKGDILNLNLCGSQMLGKERSQLKNRRFALFVSPDTSPVFNLFLEKVFESRRKETCEVKLLKNSDNPMCVLLTGISDNNAGQCNVTVVDITERRLAEQELIVAKEQAEESRNRFQSIFLIAPTGIGVVKDRVITEVNPELLRITGYTRGDLIGQSALILYPSKEEFDYVGEEKYKQIRENGTGAVETKWRKKDGTIIDVFLSSNVIYPGDYSKGVTFTAFDITSRMLSEAMFRDIIEKNPLSIQILNLDGKTIQTNSAHTRLFGASPPAEYSIFNDPQLLQQGLGASFERIKKGEIVFFPDSYFNAHDVDPSFPDVLAWIKTTGFALNGSNGVPERIVLMHEDITERKNVEAMFQDIIEKNPMSIQIVDKDGYTITGNPAYINLFGVIPPPGFSIFADLKDKSPEFGRLMLLAQRGQVVHLPDTDYNTRDISPDLPDNPVWIRALVFPLKDINGKADRFVLMHENITERKQTENEIRLLNETLELRIAERTKQLETVNKDLTFHLSELEQFSYVSNHDLQEPLRTLTQFTQLLNEKCAGILDEEGKKYIEFIGKAATRMSMLVKDLLEYSLLGKESVKTIVDCNKVVEEVLSDLDDSIKLSRAKINVQELPTLDGYETELRLLFQNLVGNAIKYQKPDMVPEINISAVSHDKEWLFSIRDNGIGIDQKYHERVFIIFQRLHNRNEFEGTGIGLAHCKKIVELHGGRIWVESNKDFGSTSNFTIPDNLK